MLIFNVVSISILIFFLLPLILAAVREKSSEIVNGNLLTLYGGLEFVLSLFFSFVLIKWIFFKYNENPVFGIIYYIIPGSISDPLKGQDFMTYLFVLPFVLIIVILIFRGLMVAIYQKYIIKFNEVFLSKLKDKSEATKIVLNVVFQLPTAIIIVLVYSSVLTFYSYYSRTPLISKLMYNSNIYQGLYVTVLDKMLSPNLTKEVVIIPNNMFQIDSPVVKDRNTSQDTLNIVQPNIERTSKKVYLTNDYLNGMDIEEFVRGNSDIEKITNQMCINDTKSKVKALKIYKWIVSNIQYDNEKVQRLASSSKGINCSAQMAFVNRKGVCFDFASLFVTMCRYEKLKVQLVTGIAYSNSTWGDHCWNRVFIEEEGRWINIDTTFGLSGDYFDKVDFISDHSDETLQKSWE